MCSPADRPVEDEVDLFGRVGQALAGVATVRVAEQGVSGRRRSTATSDSSSCRSPQRLAHPASGACVDIDPEQSEASRRKLLDSLADTDTLVLGTHFAPPTAGRVITREDALPARACPRRLADRLALTQWPLRPRPAALRAGRPPARR